MHLHLTCIYLFWSIGERFLRLKKQEYKGSSHDLSFYIPCRIIFSLSHMFSISYIYIYIYIFLSCCFIASNLLLKRFSTWIWLVSVHNFHIDLCTFTNFRYLN
jgi:hypothetical protein